MKATTKILNGLLIFAICTLAACGGQQKEESVEDRAKGKEETGEKAVENQVKALKEEAMEIHDEVMPKKDSLLQLKHELEKQLEDAKSGAQSEELEQGIKALEKADEAMMEWMRRMSRFQNQADTMAQNRQKEFLEQEKEAMKEVRTKMLESMKEAREILESEEKKNQKPN